MLGDTAMKAELPAKAAEHPHKRQRPQAKSFQRQGVACYGLHQKGDSKSCMPENVVDKPLHMIPPTALSCLQGSKIAELYAGNDDSS